MHFWTSRFSTSANRPVFNQWRITHLSHHILTAVEWLRLLKQGLRDVTATVIYVLSPACRYIKWQLCTMIDDRSPRKLVPKSDGDAFLSLSLHLCPFNFLVSVFPPFPYNFSFYFRYPPKSPDGENQGLGQISVRNRIRWIKCNAAGGYSELAHKSEGTNSVHVHSCQKSRATVKICGGHWMTFVHNVQMHVHHRRMDIEISHPWS